MDLRLRLILYLGALVLALLAGSGIVIVQAVRDDAAAEVRASERLARVMLSAGEFGQQGNADRAERLAALLAEGPLRHLTVTLAGGNPTPPLPAAPLAQWVTRALGIAPPETETYQIEVSGQQLVIRPNPASEIEERLQDATRLCVALLIFSGLTLVVAWTAAHRALAPVRDLERGLDRLAAGERQAALPAFELKEFASIARAIDHLAGALDVARASQQRLARQLIAVQEAERRQLAQELHDEMGQLLTGIGVTGAYVERHAADAPPERLAECGREVVRESRALSAHLRTLLQRLRPYGLDGPGLPDALQELVRSWQQREGSIHFELDLSESLPPLEEAVGLVVYRVMQEALTNVVRHSQATACSIALASEAGCLLLAVADDGIGRVADLNGRPAGGLLGMRERLAMVGGVLELEDNHPAGICLRARIPTPAAGKEMTE